MSFYRVNKEDEKIKKLEKEISRYLSHREFSADTLDGILDWWVDEQPVEGNKHLIKQAVDNLIKKGFLDKRVMPDGTELFHKKQ